MLKKGKCCLYASLTILAVSAVLSLAAPAPSFCTVTSHHLPYDGIPEQSLSRVNVALLKSDYTSAHFTEKWPYEQIIYKWLTVLAGNGIKHRLITDSELEGRRLQEFSVLVLPAVLCMSQDEKHAIRAFLEEGKGVIATWAIGPRDHDGNWLGWDFVHELTSSDSADHLGERPALWVTFSGNSPLSIGLGPGFRMELVGGWQIGVSRADRDAYWSDWNMNPNGITGRPHSDVAVARTLCGNGRTVWFGFNITDVITDSLNQKGLTRLLLNAIQWAGRIPMQHVWYWPDDHQGAAVFTQDVEYLFQNGANAVDVLKEEGVRGTFFCVSDLAAEHPDLVREFTKVGEVANHSDNHEQFKGQPFELQFTRLKRSNTSLESMSGTEVKGLRPPYELCDEATLTAWAILGGEYVFGQPDDSPAMMPQFVTLEENPSRGLASEDSLVIIRRIGADDYTTLEVEALPTNEEILSRHKLDMDRIYSLSGLYMFGYHSNLMCVPERVDVLSSMVRHGKSLDLWLATAGDIASWWKKILDVSTKMTIASRDSLLLSVINKGSQPVEALSVAVYLPETCDHVRIESASADISVPHYDTDDERLAVRIDTLKANSVQTYTIKYR